MTSLRVFFLGVFGALLHGMLALPSCAQSTWEVTPYQVQVWWQAAEVPELPDSWAERCEAELTRQLRTQFAGVCEAKVVPPPASMQAVMRRDLATLTREELLAANPELSKLDKLFLATVHFERQTFHVSVREFDCLLTHLSATSHLATNQLSQVLPHATQLIADVFSPVVRIERAADGIAKTRLRAAALMQRPDAPGSLRPGDILLPYDRRVQSSGKADPKNIRPVDWTYLQVPTELQVGMQPLDIISGYRQPLRSKRSRRQQQYAIRTRPAATQTVIRLLSRSEKEPLAGYEIHEKGEEITEFLGYTNWLGELAIQRSGSAGIRMLLVRSGTRVLAKLPIVPGLRDEVIAYLRDDRLRVEADGFLSGVQMGIIDLVARRESLTTRIRNRIADRDFDAAERLLDELRDLPTQDDFRVSVDRQLSTLDLSSSSLKTQINTTFVQTVSTLGKYLDPNRARELESELDAARGQ